MEIIIAKSEDSDHTKSKYELRRTDPNQLLISEVRLQVFLITNYKLTTDKSEDTIALPITIS